MCEARGEQGIQEPTVGKTVCPRPATGGIYSASGGVKEHLCVCVCVHVCRSEYQQLLWGCVLRGSHAQVPLNGKTEGPGPATGQSVCLSPASGGVR